MRGLENKKTSQFNSRNCVDSTLPPSWSVANDPLLPNWWGCLTFQTQIFGLRFPTFPHKFLISSLCRPQWEKKSYLCCCACRPKVSGPQRTAKPAATSTAEEPLFTLQASGLQRVNIPSNIKNGKWGNSFWASVAWKGVLNCKGFLRCPEMQKRFIHSLLCNQV